MDDWNRDVLVTILALVADAIRRPGLSTASSGLSKDRNQSLAQTLVDKGVLDGEPHSRARRRRLASPRATASCRFGPMHAAGSARSGWPGSCELQLHEGGVEG